MSVKVTFPEPKPMQVAKGTAGLHTLLGGCCTTVSALREASTATNPGLVKPSIG